LLAIALALRAVAGTTTKATGLAIARTRRLAVTTSEMRTMPIRATGCMTLATLLMRTLA
jgi:hypothetical protein